MKNFLFVLLLLPYLLFSQENENRSRYGIFAGYGLNSHSADFKRLPDCPNCSPGFKDGSGGGLNFGLTYDYPLSKELYFSSKLIYKNLSGKLVSIEKTAVIAEGIPTDGEFEHSLDATLVAIGFEPGIKLNLIDNLNLNFGFNFSILQKKDYSQVETITKPTDYGTFLNPDGTDSQSRERNKFSGTMKDANSLYLAPMASISYLINLDKRKEWLIEPEMAYHFGISNIVNDEMVKKWSVNTLSFGIAIKYSPAKFIPKQEKYYEEYKIDTVRIEKDMIASNFARGKESVKIDTRETSAEIITTKSTSRTDTVFTQRTYKLKGSIAAVGLDNEGREIPNPQFVVEEFVSNRLDPLLNYIFFEDNSARLPSRYIVLNSNETNEFEIEKLFYDSTLEIYYNLLNIVGKRMLENPTARITLTGCNSDYGVEKGNTELSRKRAEEVKSYLIKTWNIAESRITIQARNLPLKASTPLNEPDKIEENRRVEITSDNQKIIEPIFIEKIDRTANPPVVRFKLQAESEAGFKNWEVIASQSNDNENKFKHSQAGQIEPQIEWELAQYQKITPKYPGPILAELHLEDMKGGKHIAKTQTAPIEIITINQKRTNRVGDYEIEKFSLILFDFDKATIENQNKSIAEFIKTRIKTESTIEITGYTDRTGSPDYNKRLSERRAISTKEALNRSNAVTIGMGQEILLYNNDLPEGRFYCRTVEAILKTKVK